VSEHERTRANSGERMAANDNAPPRLTLAPFEVPEPRRDVPHQRLEREAAEVARARYLLTQLRPHGPGPEERLDGPVVASPSSPGGARTSCPDVPKGAFVRDAGGAAATDVLARIARVPFVRARASLTWLRRSGSLAAGYGPLALSLAVAIADDALRGKWASDAKRGQDRARVWGALRLDEAFAAWEAA